MSVYRTIGPLVSNDDRVLTLTYFTVMASNNFCNLGVSIGRYGSIEGQDHFFTLAQDHLIFKVHGNKNLLA